MTQQRARVLHSAAGVLLLAAVHALAADPATPGRDPQPVLQTLRVEAAGAGTGFSLQHPGTWTAVEDGDTSTTLLLNVDAASVNAPQAASANRLLVTFERRLSAEDAQLRLRQIASETTPDIVVEYTQLGGWPALVRTFSDVMPKIGQEDRAG